MLTAIIKLSSIMLYVFEVLDSTFWFAVAFVYSKRGGKLWIRTILGCWLSVILRAGSPSYILGVAIAGFISVRSGVKSVSVVEFGVGRGGGMMSLVKISRLFSRLLDVKINVVGVDNGSGLPQPKDSRDHPEIWKEGEFRLTESKILPRLQRLLSNERARLIIGDLNTDIARVSRSIEAASTPVGFISIDVDYYSSTKPVLDWISRSELRSFIDYCPLYFDDTDSLWSFNKFSGQALAIKEFNDTSNNLYIERKHRALKLYSLIKTCPAKGTRFSDLALPHQVLARIVSPAIQAWV